MNETFSLPAFTMADYNLHRADERFFYLFAAVALAFCVFHILFRIFMRKRTAAPITPIGNEEPERHSLFQRLFHWGNALAVFALIFSGWMLYQLPSPVPLEAQAASIWFSWHLWGVVILAIVLLAHVVREAFIATDENEMALGRTAIERILSFFRDFKGFFNAHPPTGKYHTGQIFFHWAAAGNMLALIVTGMAIWKPLRDFLPLSLFGLGWDFIYFSRVLHGLFTATLVANLIVHIYFALGVRGNWPAARSMVTGSMPRK